MQNNIRGKIYLVSPRGFCAGVVRAINTVEKALTIFKKPIYIKGKIVHNTHVIENLKNKGAIFVDDIELIPDGSYVVYSAHGVTKEDREESKIKKLIEIDATCVLVEKLHLLAKKYRDDGYKIILIGNKNHEEIKGIYSETKENIFIVESVDDVDKIPFSKKNEKIICLMQTTLNYESISPILEMMEEKFQKLEKIPSSICYATTNRQKALLKMLDSMDVDLVLVIGDRLSSNSNKLRELALSKKKRAFLIQDFSEITKETFESFLHDQNRKNIIKIGITSGASTPEYVVQKCIERVGQFFGDIEINEFVFTKENITFALPKILL